MRRRTPARNPKDFNNIHDIQGRVGHVANRMVGIESFWRKTAIWVTAGSFVALIFLTLDSMSAITAGSKRVPAYSVINHRIDYVFDEKRNFQVPVIGVEEPLFGKKLTEAEAEALVSHGKLTTQAKNCMNCHTLLGNGAYYAPDLTKAWLDPSWGTKEVREQEMVDFLMNPQDRLHNAVGRRMPNLGITEAEARATVAFLKWMSSIDTNGFPYNFKPIDQSDPPPAEAPAVNGSRFNSKEADMATLGKLDSANLNGGQKLAVKYFTVALALFGAQILFGLLARHSVPEARFSLRRARFQRQPHGAHQRPGGVAAVRLHRLGVLDAGGRIGHPGGRAQARQPDLLDIHPGGGRGSWWSTC